MQYYAGTYVVQTHKYRQEFAEMAALGNLILPNTIKPSRNMNFRRIVSEAALYLPYTGDVNVESMTVPFVESREIETGRTLQRITCMYLLEYEKDYIDEVCVGWKFKRVCEPS